MNHGRGTRKNLIDMTVFKKSIPLFIVSMRVSDEWCKLKLTRVWPLVSLVSEDLFENLSENSGKNGFKSVKQRKQSDYQMYF